ncbi:translation initiation factor IF-3 [Candidatus Woesebacteria bacterium GWB1_43_5]|uniref:Translation initiation factor IF-3 n=1 Tax=Candidatus Woesebacteria bacterium GWB1_43_5 TaxID=1802474 RepID=A0A1F7WR20_9BACT|nr:MAG: translation initiation factor IF-3 [Candidatus Woesebacteria bacterium GWB1_43_5]
MDKRNWRINNQIRAPKVRVIGADGKQVGVLGISEAVVRAKEESLDLVEIAPQAKPPVVKIVELGKFLYQEEKKARAQKLKTKASELKEMRFSPFIGQSDFETRLTRVREFLGDKNKVRIVIKFKGRQMEVKQAGYAVTNKILAILGESVAVDMQPKFLGRHLVMVISPTNKKVVKEAKGLDNLS